MTLRDASATIVSRPWRAGALALAALLIGAGGCRLANEADHLASRWTRLRHTQERVAHVARWRRERTALDRRADSLRQAFAAAVAADGDPEAASPASRAVLRLAAAAGLHLAAFETTSAPPGPGAPGAGAPGAEAYATMSIELEGRFHGVLRFLDAVERAPRRWRVHRLELSPRDAGSPVLRARLELRTTPASPPAGGR